MFFLSQPQSIYTHATLAWRKAVNQFVLNWRFFLLFVASYSYTTIQDNYTSITGFCQHFFVFLKNFIEITTFQVWFIESKIQHHYSFIDVYLPSEFLSGFTIFVSVMSLIWIYIKIQEIYKRLYLSQTSFFWCSFSYFLYNRIYFHALRPSPPHRDSSLSPPPRQTPPLALFLCSNMTSEA